MRLSSFTAAAVLALVVAMPSAGEGLASAADTQAHRVGAFLDGLKARKGAMRELSVVESRSLVGLGAECGMNAFELFDAVYRWASSADVRLRIGETGLKEASRVFDIGRDRVRSLLPLDRMTNLEIGAALSPDQSALAGNLEKPYSEYVEIGTIRLSTSFGFGALEPNRYLKPYGISVSRFPLSAALDRLELYAPHKGAIYLSGVAKPKRWNLWPITKR